MTQDERSTIASGQTLATVTATATTIIPKPPKNAQPEELSELAGKANELVLQFQQNPQNRRLASRLTSIGMETQIEAANVGNLLQTKIKPLLNEAVEGGGKIPDGLVRLRSTADDLNPEVLLSRSPKGWIAKILRKIPGMDEALANIALRMDSAQETIKAIISGLRAAALERQADNEELLDFVDRIDLALDKVRREAYQLELMFAKLQSDLVTQEGALEDEARQRVGAEMQRLATRIQDMRSMETALVLGIVETYSVIDGNNDLIDTVGRVSTITQFIMMVALLNHIATQRQQKMAKFVTDTIKFNNDLIEYTAKEVGLGAVKAAELLANPVISLEALQKGMQNLFEQLDRADRIKADRIAKAKEALPKLTEMTEKLEARRGIQEAGSQISTLPLSQ